MDISWFALVCICACVSKTRDLAAGNARGAQAVTSKWETALLLGRQGSIEGHLSTSFIDYASFSLCFLSPPPEEPAAARELLWSVGVVVFDSLGAPAYSVQGQDVGELWFVGAFSMHFSDLVGRGMLFFIASSFCFQRAMG